MRSAELDKVSLTLVLFESLFRVLLPQVVDAHLALLHEVVLLVDLSFFDLIKPVLLLLKLALAVVELGLREALLVIDVADEDVHDGRFTHVLSESLVRIILNLRLQGRLNIVLLPEPLLAFLLQALFEARVELQVHILCFLGGFPPLADLGGPHPVRLIRKLLLLNLLHYLGLFGRLDTDVEA